MTPELVWKEFVRTQRRLNELGSQLAAFSINRSKAARTVIEARAAALNNYGLPARTLSLIRESPEKLWTNRELAELLNVGITNISPALYRLTRGELIVRIERGLYRAKTLHDDLKMPRFVETGINPNTIRGRMLELINDAPKRCFTCEEIAKKLKCQVNAARQAAYVLHKDQMIIRDRHGQYRAVRDSDEEVVF